MDFVYLLATFPVLVSAGSALVTGCTLVIGRKFSASRFWDHCVENNITVFHVTRVYRVEQEDFQT